MPELPSFTIVTPCLNAAATLPVALESVRSQAYPRVEHVVVDGGSVDGTRALLEGLNGVRYVSEPDRGLSDAVNKGIRMATGEVIGWLNADDAYEPGALHAVGRALAERSDAAWATGRCRIVDGRGAEIRKPVTAYKNLFLRHWSFPLYLTHNFVSSPSTFVRRAALDDVGLLSESYRYSMDYDLWLRLARCHRPLVLDRDLAAFRMEAGSLSMTGFERQFEEHAENARVHGAGHPLPVAVNIVLSRLIVLAYRGMRYARRPRAT